MSGKKQNGHRPNCAGLNASQRFTERCGGRGIPLSPAQQIARGTTTGSCVDEYNAAEGDEFGDGRDFMGHAAPRKATRKEPLTRTRRSVTARGADLFIAGPTHPENFLGRQPVGDLEECEGLDTSDPESLLIIAEELAELEIDPFAVEACGVEVLPVVPKVLHLRRRDEPTAA